MALHYHVALKAVLKSAELANVSPFTMRFTLIDAGAEALAQEEVLCGELLTLP